MQFPISKWCLDNRFLNSCVFHVRSRIGWRGGERSILYKGIETSPQQTCFKNLEEKPERESPKRTIFASGGLELLQMVLE